MIYFDNAATTLQKPKVVTNAMVRAMQTCANPGRGGHKAAMEAARVVYKCREVISDYFDLDDPTRVIFTQNATHSLNIAIQNIMRDGGHAIVSGYEHNSVIRPLSELESKGCRYTIAYAPLYKPKAQILAIENAIQDDTVCIVLNHVSNVFGYIQDVKMVNQLCKKYRLKLILDLSQSAGILPISIKQLSEANYLCMPGHKGLYGPQGTGVLICCKGALHYSITQGGTGSESLNFRQPSTLPEALESGTLNVPGIAGLCEGVRFVNSLTPSTISSWESDLLVRFVGKAKNIPGLQVFYGDNLQTGVVSLKCDQMTPEDLGEKLAARGFCLRAGLHCAPVAHQSANTLPEGTLRASFSVFNRKSEVDALCYAILKTIS